MKINMKNTKNNIYIHSNYILHYIIYILQIHYNYNINGKQFMINSVDG